MLDFLRKLFLNLDFFGKSTTLLFKNDTYYKTSLGFSCSILLIILSAIGASYFLTSFLDRLNPMIAFSQLDDPGPLVFKEQQFSIAFSIKNQTILDKQLIAEMSSQGLLLSTFPIFQNESCGIFTNINQSLFCLKISKITQPWALDSLQIRVFDNSTGEKNSFEEYEIFYEELLINNVDFENPVQIISAHKKIHNLKSFTKAVNFELEKVEVVTDRGLMVEDRDILPFFRVLSKPHEVIYDKSDALFIMNIEKSSSKVSVTRNYTKLYTVLANLGGLMRMLWLMIFVMINPFITVLYQKSLINDIFNFNDKEFFFNDDHLPQKTRPSQINEAIIKFKAFVRVFKADYGKKKNMTKSLRSAQNQAKIDSPMKEVIGDVFKVKETSLDISILESLMYYVCNYKTLRMKKELIKRGSKAINKRIDISYIIQKLVEVEKLKVLLLDADQLKLFEYLPKPLLTNNKKAKLFSKKKFFNKVQDTQTLITLNYFQEKWKQMDEDKNNKNILEKITSLFESYQRIKFKEHLTETDQKLLNMLDTNIKTLLEKTENSPKLKRFITEKFSKSNTHGNLKMLLSLATNNIGGNVPPTDSHSQDRNKNNFEEEEDKKMFTNKISSLFNRTKRENEFDPMNKLILFSKELTSMNSSMKKPDIDIENINQNPLGMSTYIKDVKIEERQEFEEEELKSEKVGDIKKEVLRLNSKFKFMQQDDESQETGGNLGDV